MGCGKSKHDVVTGNTKTVKKPSEAESVKGKENEKIKRQESCRCRKTNDIFAAVSGDQRKTVVENNSQIHEEKETGRICERKEAGETHENFEKREEKEPTTPPSVTVNENAMPIDEQNEKVEIEETLIEENNDGDAADIEIPPLEVEEQNSDVQTPVMEIGVQETPTTENENAEIPPLDVEEPKSDVQTPVTEISVEGTPTTENDETPATDLDVTPVLKEEDKVDVVEENTSDITKEVESDA